MKFIYLFITIFLFTASVHAQAPSMQWFLKPGYGYGNGNATKSITSDAAGNVYYTGMFTGTINFGTDTLQGSGPYQSIFIVKYDSRGNVKWTRRSYSSSLDEAHSICVDNSGDVYVTGYFYSNRLVFGTTTLFNADSGLAYAMFIVKYDSAGNFIWAKSTNSHSSMSTGNGIVADASGNIFVTGEYSGSAFTSAGLPVISANQALFTIKYNSTGTVLWAKSAIATGDAFVNGIALDNTGNICIAGYYRYGQITFSPYTLTYPSSNQSIYITSYDGTTGSVRWAKSEGGLSGGQYDYGNGVAADGSGNFYLTGYFRGDFIQFGGITLNNPVPSSGNACIFLTKFNNSGTPVWAKTPAGGTAGDDMSNCVATDPAGNCYIAGVLGSSADVFGTTTLSGGPFIVRYDPTGKVLWAKNLNTGGGQPLCVAADLCSNSYFGGSIPTGGGYSYSFIGKLGFVNTTSAKSTCIGDNNGSASVSFVNAGVPPYTYLWSNGGTSSTITGVSAGIYTVTITQANGCMETIADTVTSISNIRANFSASNVSCSGPCTGYGTISPTGGIPPYSYLWDASAGSQTVQTASGLCPQSYTVKITDSLGCVLLDTVKVTANSLPSIQANIQNIATVDQATVDPSLYLWYNYDLPVTINTNSSNPGNYLDPGKYVRLKARGYNRKSDQTTITSGQCVVRTNSIYLTITDSLVGFNPIAYRDTVWSNDEFELQIKSNTPAGSTAYFDLVILDNGNEYTTTCVSLPVTPLVYSARHQPVIDADTLNSRGNGNGFCEPGEIITFAPKLNNIGTKQIYTARGTLENLDSLDYITIWNDRQGVAGNVTDTAWWDFTTLPQIINPGTKSITATDTFVFSYRNLSLVHDFKLYNVMEGGFKLFQSSLHSLFRWTIGYEFNDPTLGFKVPVPENTVNIYPNPSDGNLFIQLTQNNGPVMVTVLDITGRILASNSYRTNLIHLNMDLNDGIYLVRITNQDTYETITRKVIIRK